MRSPVSKTKIPAIEIIEEKVKELAPEAAIEETVHVFEKSGSTFSSASFSLTWRGKRKNLVLYRAFLDDLRDAPNRHDDDWQNLMQKLETQIMETIQELGYHSGKIGFKR